MMAKKSGYGICYVLITLFTFLMPVLVSGFDKKAVIYLALAFVLAVFGHEKGIERSVAISKTVALTFLLSVFSFAGLFFVSDKGAHFYLASFLLLCTLIGSEVSRLKDDMGEEKFSKAAEGVLFKASVVYAFVVLLWQIFIDSEGFLTKMDMGGGARQATGIIMLFAICIGVKRYRDGHRSTGVVLSVVVACYNFLMTKSLLCFFILMLMLSLMSIEKKNRKVEALLCLVATAVLGVMNVIYAVAEIWSGKVVFGSMTEGLKHVAGIGFGGFAAQKAVLGILPGEASVFCSVVEWFGVVGVAAVAAIVLRAVVYWKEKRDFYSLLALCGVIVMLLGEVDGMFVLLPVLCMYYASCEKSVRVDLPVWVNYVVIVPVLFFLSQSLARGVLWIGDMQKDVQNYHEAESLYATAAEISLFDSEPWVKAYEAADKQESGEESNEMYYLEMAYKFNKKNYGFYRTMSDIYTERSDHERALQVFPWDEDMDESLYVPFGEKLLNALSVTTDMDVMRARYDMIEEFASKATDKEVKKEMNDILAKSQRYYVNLRDGSDAAGDMFEEESEAPLEEET